MIEVSHLTKRYGGHTAVSNLSFTIEKGQIYGFLGPNGAGKSTTMNIMTGCLAASEGEVRIDGHDIFEEPQQAKRLIGYLPEQPPLYLDRTPREYLTFVGRAKGIKDKTLPEQIGRVMEVTQITDVADRLIKHLSKGYRQRVGIAQALLGDPEVVLGKYGALLVVFLAPMAVIGVYPLILSAFGNVYLPAAYSAWLGFFLLGAALLAIGMFISSLTESQAVAAGLCFVVMLVNYFITSLADFISTTAFASFAAFTVVILALAGIVWFMTRSGLASGVLALVLEAVLLFFYAGDTSAFEGLFPEVMENLSLFDQFYQFVNGVFDLRAVVYLLSVSGLFLFLTVQSLEKRRWSE